MSQTVLRLAVSWAGIAALGLGVACSSKSSGGGPHPQDGGSSNDGATPQADAGAPDSEGGACTPGTPPMGYVLIDDMETTTHGPIEFDAGISAPLTPGYWYNSGANYNTDAGDGGVIDGGGMVDMSDPPQLSFVFSALPAPTHTLNCAISTHAARQKCVLNGQYDTCGVGFEFVQEPDLEAGAGGDAATGDASVAAPDAGDGGDAGPSIPRVTIPFDISRYRGVTFWGRTTTPDPMAGSLQVKIQFPDTDTDPRGTVCNGGSTNYTKCYNSYAAYFDFTTSWQQFIVWLDPGDGGGAPEGGIAIDPSWGYQGAQWIPTQVYGVNWQAQKNTDPTAGSLTTELWIDDVYFIQ